MDIGPQVMVVRLILAAVLGSLLGIEREMHGRAAGLCTHLLVSMAAAGFTLMSLYAAAIDPAHPESPGRIAAQIVTVLRCDLTRDHQSGQATITLMIRLLQRGLAGTRARQVCGAIEQLDIPLHRISW